MIFWELSTTDCTDGKDNFAERFLTTLFEHMAGKNKFAGIRSYDFIGVIIPPLAIYGFLAFLGFYAPLCARGFWLMLGGKPLPSITQFVIDVVKGSPVPIHWIGLGIMLALILAAGLVGRKSPTPEAALRRLFIIASVEWCCIGFSMFVSLVALPLPLIPIGCGFDYTDPSIMPRIVDSFVKSGSVMVYEGLPSPNAERTLFQSQIHSATTVSIDGWYFYRDPQTFAASDKEYLQRMLTTARPFVSATYKNMEFHPDFALEWRDAAGEKYDALFCLYRRDVKFRGPRILLDCDA